MNWLKKLFCIHKFGPTHKLKGWDSRRYVEYIFFKRKCKWCGKVEEVKM